MRTDLLRYPLWPSYEPGTVQFYTTNNIVGVYLSQACFMCSTRAIVVKTFKKLYNLSTFLVTSKIDMTW